jgi:hypothetical protein
MSEVKRPRIDGNQDRLLKKVLESISHELGVSRSRLNDSLAAGGLRDVLKAAGEATIPFSATVEASVVGAAHTEQAERTAASLKAWQPTDGFVEAGVGMQSLHRIGAIVREPVSPRSSHELVEVRSWTPYGTPYQAALRALKKGAISKSDIKAVLKLGGGNEREIVEILKAFNGLEDKLEAVDKSLQKKSDFQSGFAAVMKKHRHILNDDIGG